MKLIQIRIALFCSPEQRSGRAIILTPASANVSFMSEFLGPHYFQTI